MQRNLIFDKPEKIILEFKNPITLHPGESLNIIVPLRNEELPSQDWKHIPCEPSYLTLALMKIINLFWRN